jgi:hypothetical protein
MLDGLSHVENGNYTTNGNESTNKGRILQTFGDYSMTWKQFVAAVVVVVIAGAAPVGAQAPEFDVLIAGGTVIDGTGAARFRADVALKGDRVALISRSPIAPSRAARTIDAANRIVAPVSSTCMRTSIRSRACSAPRARCGRA